MTLASVPFNADAVTGPVPDAIRASFGAMPVTDRALAVYAAVEARFEAGETQVGLGWLMEMDIGDMQESMAALMVLCSSRFAPYDLVGMRKDPASGLEMRVPSDQMSAAANGEISGDDILLRIERRPVPAPAEGPQL